MKLPVFLILTLMASNAAAEDLKLDMALGFSHFEQQVKMEAGGAKGDVLVGDSEVGLALAGTYALKEWLELGVFFRLDFGNRRLGQFSAFNSDGAPVIINTQGGHFSEIWIGPLARYRAEHWFVELGYGLFGSRSDANRPDLANTSGSTSGAFSTSPTIAWMLAIGSNFKLSENISLLMRIEYRVRYYDQRDGENLAENMVHGTQNFSPQLGMSVNL